MIGTSLIKSAEIFPILGKSAVVFVDHLSRESDARRSARKPIALSRGAFRSRGEWVSRDGTDSIPTRSISHSSMSNTQPSNHTLENAGSTRKPISSLALRGRGYLGRAGARLVRVPERTAVRRDGDKVSSCLRRKALPRGEIHHWGRDRKSSKQPHFVSFRLISSH